MSKKIKTIGVLTPGGDAPGMNAAIRAVVRTAIGRNWEALSGAAMRDRRHMISASRATRTPIAMSVPWPRAPPFVRTTSSCDFRSCVRSQADLGGLPNCGR